MKNKYKYLCNNIGLLTLGNVGTKIISFLLIPLYTKCLSTSEYGTFDLISITVSLLIPILTLNIVQSVMIFSLDEKNDKEQIFSISIRIVINSFLIIVFFVLLNHFFLWFPVIEEWKYFFVFIFLGSAISDIIQNFAKGLEEVKAYTISGVIGFFITVMLNVVLLVYYEMGLLGFFIASLVGLYIQIVYLTIKIKCWKYLTYSYVDETLKKQLLSFSIPLIANTVSWWIIGSSDRYSVSYFCGVSAMGVYSVAYKIPQILSSIITIFGQAWGISAVKDFDINDKDNFFVNVYNLYSCFLCIMCSLLIIMDKPIASILYANSYYEAWKYVPFLLLGVVFQGLGGYHSAVFGAVKKPGVLATSSIGGAVINVALNIVLIYWLGVIGAAISTFIAFFSMWLFRMIFMRRYININFSIYRDAVVYILLVIQATIYPYGFENCFTYVIESVLCLMIMVLFQNELYKLYHKMCSGTMNYGGNHAKD